MDYEFCKPESNEDYEALYMLMDAAFQGEDVRGITKRFAEHHPEMTDDHFFMVKYGDEVAAGLVLLPQKWVLDGVELKVAEMGCVGTAPNHRRKRLQWILNDEFDAYAKENGFDLCVLAGIPYFYRQFGYQYAVELDYSTELLANKVPELPGLSVRKTIETDTSELDKILRKTQTNYFTHSVRTEGVWKMQLETGTYGGEPCEGNTLLNDGEIVAYYRYVEDEKNSTLYIRELGFKDTVTIGQVAGLLREHARQKGFDKLKTALSHEDAFSQYLIGLGAKTNTPYAWQVKPLDLFGLIQKLQPALERRLEYSEYKGLTKELRFNFFKFAVKMDFKDGVITELEKYYGEEKRTLGMNPYAFIQLILGYKGREELEKAYPDFWVRDGLDSLIDVLFPRKPGYINYTY